MTKFLLAGVAAMTMLAGCESGPTIREQHRSGRQPVELQDLHVRGEDWHGPARTTRRRSPAISRNRSAAKWTRADTSTSRAARPTCSSTSTQCAARTSTSARRRARRTARVTTAIAAECTVYGAALRARSPDGPLQGRHGERRCRGPGEEAARLGRNRGSAPDGQDDEGPAHGDQRRDHGNVRAVPRPGGRWMICGVTLPIAFTCAAAAIMPRHALAQEAPAGAAVALPAAPSMPTRSPRPCRTPSQHSSACRSSSTMTTGYGIDGDGERWLLNVQPVVPIR